MAEAAGFSALVLTVDAAIIGARETDARNRFHLPEILLKQPAPPNLDQRPQPLRHYPNYTRWLTVDGRAWEGGSGAPRYLPPSLPRRFGRDGKYI